MSFVLYFSSYLEYLSLSSLALSTVDVAGDHASSAGKIRLAAVGAGSARPDAWTTLTTCAGVCELGTEGTTRLELTRLAQASIKLVSRADELADCELLCSAAVPTSSDLPQTQA